MRGRIGYLFTPNTLGYVTGGLAYAKLRNTFNQADIPGGYTWSKTSWEAGWTLGGGVEYALTDRISLRGETLYYDLGTANRNSYFGTVPASLHDKTTGRIGLNYAFH